MLLIRIGFHRILFP